MEGRGEEERRSRGEQEDDGERCKRGRALDVQGETNAARVHLRPTQSRWRRSGGGGGVNRRMPTGDANVAVRS